MTKLVEKAAPECCNAPCCFSLTGAEECSGTLKFRQHCLLCKCCQGDRTLSPAWLPKGKELLQGSVLMLRYNGVDQESKQTLPFPSVLAFQGTETGVGGLWISGHNCRHLPYPHRL